MPPRTWGVYAARTFELAQRKGQQVYDRARFEDAVALDGLRRMSGLAERWWAEFDISLHRLAECLVDGEAPRYARRR